MSGPPTPAETHGSLSAPEITAACFPVPALLLRTNDPAAQRTISAFAHQQAGTARTLHRALSIALHSAHDTGTRVAAFTTMFKAAEDWRYEAAATSPHSVGRYSPRWAERFRTPVTDDNPNLFRIGDHARFRDGAKWDPATRIYRGGAETPASRTMRRFEAIAAARFPQSPSVDAVCNRVALPDGRIAEGTRLLRGSAARQAAAEMAARISARGGDISRITTDGSLIYAASTPGTDHRAIFHRAMTLLAVEHATPADALAAWLQAAYLLYQAPRKKRGADATIRTFLIAAGVQLLPEPPVLPHDIDLRAYVQTQDLFVTELRTVQNIAKAPVRRPA
ncbi:MULTISPECIES: hypothetical protein [unclassified Streptomyces]|uniref:hypothetical protein n=1 Tax=unclassified Streptomyces TaxID=2593676 RepID=UPI002E2AA083|nr:hypothetical protein [Streptomyces sp. NBC_00223]